MIERALADITDVAVEADDAAGYFAALYARVMADVAEGIGTGRFEDAERMERLAVTFADYYLRARGGETSPSRCWQATWDVAGDPDLVIVQHLLLGINAHVNHDLAQAVVDVAPDTGGLDPVRHDFDSMNDVLAGTFDAIIHDLDHVSRWTGEVAAWGGGRLFNFSLRVARAQAWDAAERLHALDDDGRRAYVAELDRLVSVLAYLITRPALVVAVPMWLARRLEERDPKVVTRALLGPLALASRSGRR